MTTPTAGDALAKHVQEQLAEERARKASLETRGLALITSSGAFVTLILAITAVVSGRKGFHLPDLSRGFLLAAAVLLLLAALFGVLSNRPRDYEEPAAADLRTKLEAYWSFASEEGRRVVAQSDADTLIAARKRNQEKATLLLNGAWAQIVGMGCIVAAAACVLLSR